MQNATVMVVTGEDIPSVRRLVEISHEALIREWDLLKNWIQTNHEVLRRREHIRARLRQWEEQDRDPTLLLPPGLPLEEGRKLLADHGDVLIDEVQPYIEASAVAAKAEEDVARAAQRARVRVARLIAAAMAVLALVAIGGGTIAWWQRGEAQRNAEEAQRNESRALASLAEAEVERGSPATAVRLALAALPMRLDSPDRPYARVAEVVLLDSMQHLRERLRFLHDNLVSSVVFGPDGRMLATASGDKSARLWEVATGKEIEMLRGHDDGVSSVAFSPDGRMLATASGDKSARLWEVATRKEIDMLRGHEDGVYAVAFSPDGRTLATASGDNTARLWELLEQGLVDLACARVHFLPLSERDRQRFGITKEWCTPEVSAELRAKLRLEESETSSAFGTTAR